MTKRDYIWVAIRIFGLYLLVEAIIAFCGALSTGIFLFCQPYVAQEADHAMETVRNTEMVQFISSIVRLFICGLSGIYFLKGGNGLLKLICPPESDTKA